MSEIVSVMLGTAGHVDHGKTSLVRNLTGFDTDRHPEERERGVSIDFAVAPFPLADGRIAGIIDVPGHEDFIRNMVSGASAIDLLLLVIAADDAVMPQTVEHLRIAKSLGMSGLIVVVTKIDLVSADVLEIVEADVRRFLSDSGFPHAPLVAVSNVSKVGLERLREEIEKAVSELKRAEDSRAFRMPIRQVFSAKGHGIILTGVPVSGSLVVDHSVEILPLEKRATVRGIQNYRHASESTLPHRSSAINLRVDFDPELIHRGMVLAEPGVYSSTTQVIAWFRNDSSDSTLQPRREVLFHSGTLACVAKVRMIDCSEVAPGAEAFIRLRFQHPVVLAAGDTFVLRHNSSQLTFGGGSILSTHISRSRKLSEALFDRLVLAQEALNKKNYLLCELLAGSRFCFNAQEILSRSQHGEEQGMKLIRALVAEGYLMPLGPNAWLLSSRQGELQLAIRRAAEHYHKIQKFTWGMKPTYVCELLQLPASSYESLLLILLGDPSLQEKYGRLALASFEPQISPREIRVREDVLKAVQHAGIQSIAKGTLLEQLKITEKELKGALRLLADEQVIVQFGANVLLHSLVVKFRQDLLELFAQKPLVELMDFREKSGASRNVAALVLDSFDAEGLTKRTEKGRVLVKR